MIWRELQSHCELQECLSFTKDEVGIEAFGFEKTLSAWKILTKYRSFISAVVESPEPVNGHKILGFGAGVFVTKQFIEQELLEPRPGMNLRILSSILSGKPAILDDAALRRANTSDGVSVVILSGAVRRESLTPQLETEVEALIFTSFYELYKGYKLNMIVREARTAFDVEFMRSQRVYGTIDTFDKYFNSYPDSAFNRDRALFVCTARDALNIPGTVPYLLFQYREPILHLPDGEQQLIIAALRGLTDDQLATQLNMKLPAIKKRWASLLTRLADALPDLFPETVNGFDRLTRGPQKRHRVLAYFRIHPEELRPHLRLRPRPQPSWLSIHASSPHKVALNKSTAR